MRYADAAGAERVVSIVGIDEVDLNRNHISWASPLGRGLILSPPVLEADRHDVCANIVSHFDQIPHNCELIMN